MAPPAEAPSTDAEQAPVRLKVLADPREGVLKVAGRAVAVGDVVELPPGQYTFTFQGPGWQARCEREVRRGMRRIKFSYRDREKEFPCQVE